MFSLYYRYHHYFRMSCQPFKNQRNRDHVNDSFITLISDKSQSLVFATSKSYNVSGTLFRKSSEIWSQRVHRGYCKIQSIEKRPSDKKRSILQIVVGTGDGRITVIV